MDSRLNGVVGKTEECAQPEQERESSKKVFGKANPGRRLKGCRDLVGPVSLEYGTNLGLGKTCVRISEEAVEQIMEGNLVVLNIYLLAKKFYVVDLIQLAICLQRSNDYFTSCFIQTEYTIVLLETGTLLTDLT